MKHQKQLADSLISEEKKLADALDEELAVLETEVGATEADQKAAASHLDAIISEASGEEPHEEAVKDIEAADKQAEQEKAELEGEAAVHVAELASHLTKATANKLRDIAESIESSEAPEQAESIGEAEAKVLSDVQKSEEEEQNSFAEAEERTEQEGVGEKDDEDEGPSAKKVPTSARKNKKELVEVWFLSLL